MQIVRNAVDRRVPDHSLTRYEITEKGRAEKLRDAGDFKGAADAIVALIRQNPKLGKNYEVVGVAMHAYNKLARKTGNPEDFRSALTYAELYLKLDPDNVPALGIAVYASYQLKKYSKTLEYGRQYAFKNAFEEGQEAQNHVPMYYMIAIAADDCSEDPEAIEFCQRILDIKNDDLPALRLMKDIYERSAATRDIAKKYREKISDVMRQQMAEKRSAAGADQRDQTKKAA